MSNKMATEQFCLRWNDFHSNITSAFSDIRDDDEFLDVTLVSSSKFFRSYVPHYTVFRGLDNPKHLIRVSLSLLL